MKLLRYLPALALAFSLHPLPAAVINNQATVTGTGSIDPTGAEELDTVATVVSGSGQASKATLEARPDFRVIQTWPALDGPILAGTSATNYYDYTTANLPDIQFTVSGLTTTNTGKSTAFSGDPYYTSVGNGLNLDSSANSGTVTLTITFGTYSTGSGTLTADQVVDATAFTLSNIITGRSVSASFFNAAGVNLLTLTQAGGTDPGGIRNASFPGLDSLFAYQGNGTVANAVSRIEITRQGGNFLDGATLDDFGFSNAIAVPEPSTFAMLIGGLGMLIGFQRRRLS